MQCLPKENSTERRHLSLTWKPIRKAGESKYSFTSPSLTKRREAGEKNIIGIMIIVLNFTIIIHAVTCISLYLSQNEIQSHVSI